jgi:phosphate starvation-inducible protein PhoH and related proteins
LKRKAGKEEIFSKKFTSKKKRTKNDKASIIAISEFKNHKFSEERDHPPLIALNARQDDYLTALKTSPQIIVTGPAGTGKTWIAASYAADLFRKGKIGKIILTRPTVPCGRSLGFFPGTLEEKFSPWASPVLEAIKERMGTAAFEIALKRSDIEMVPFEVMRGRSWKNAFILLDEAQNTTISEIKMFLTRIGEGTQTVINGDIRQCDLEAHSGLGKVIEMIKQQSLPVPVIEFEIDDIVRSGLCAMWVKAFDRAEIPVGKIYIDEMTTRIEAAFRA